MRTPRRHGIRLPHSRRKRIVLGWALVVGGVFGWLPILGFWMVPLGLVVLSVDLPRVRRFRRRATVSWGRSRLRVWVEAKCPMRKAP